MRKRGAHIRHRAKAPPGLVVQALDKTYEVRLRSAVESFRSGYTAAAHFNDLADTHDLMKLALAIYGKGDAGAEAALEISGVALWNIRDRYTERGRWGATGEELKALDLLAQTSLDYWNRRSGALFAEAYRQLQKIRREQREKEKSDAAH